MKKKILFYRNMIGEILETLCSICLYLEHDGRYTHNPLSEIMHDHFKELKVYSYNIREKQEKQFKGCDNCKYSSDKCESPRRCNEHFSGWRLRGESE